MKPREGPYPNQGQLDILLKSIKDWNRWREDNPSTKPFLKNAKLAGAKLSGADLSRADLFRTKLSRANLSGADLYGADFTKADLSGADLSQADLREATLKRANLNDARLFEAFLSKTNLDRAELQSANLEGAILDGANLPGADLSGANLSGANLSGAKLSEAKLYRSDLSRANLAGANLAGANLAEAILPEANLVEVNLAGAYLAGAILFRTDLFGADLKEAILEKADLKEAILEKADLNKANLKGANLRRANLENALGNKANLNNARLWGANLINSKWDGSILTGACLWETQRAGWSIKGVICEYAYWDKDSEIKETYKAGQFERLFSEDNKIELQYQHGISPIEITTLPMLMRHLESSHKGLKLRFKSIEETGNGAMATIVIDEAGDEDLETLAETVKSQANDIKEAQQAFLKEKTEREKAELLLNAFKDDFLPSILKQLPPARMEVGTMNIDKSSNKIEFKDSTVGDIGSVGTNSKGSINKGIASEDLVKILSEWKGNVESTIDAEESLSPDDKIDLKDHIAKIEKEIAKEDQAEPGRLEKLFHVLKEWAPDIFDVAVEASSNPLKVIGLAWRMVKDKISITPS